jgi:hypothetical protein
MKCDLIHQLKLKFILTKKQIIFQSNLIMFFQKKKEEIAGEVMSLKLSFYLDLLTAGRHG